MQALAFETSGHGKQRRQLKTQLRRDGVEMADMNKFSEQVIDMAERFADITDAAQGRGNRKSTGARWLIIPAAGAGLYALGASGSFKRGAKKVMSQARERASELQDDLM